MPESFSVNSVPPAAMKSGSVEGYTGAVASPQPALAPLSPEEAMSVLPSPVMVMKMGSMVPVATVPEKPTFSSHP